jgi:hypothetical protein
MPQSDFWERLKNRLIEVGNSAADFAEEQAIVGKLKFDILNLRRKVDHALHDIGSRVLEMSSMSPDANPLKDREVVELIDLIGDLELHIEHQRKEITEVADQIRRRRTAPSSRPVRPAAPVAPPPRATAPKKANKPVAKPKASVKPKSAAKKPKAPKLPVDDTEPKPPARPRGRPKKVLPES